MTPHGAALVLALCNPAFGGGDPPILYAGPAVALLALLLFAYFFLIDILILLLPTIYNIFHGVLSTGIDIV